MNIEDKSAEIIRLNPAAFLDRDGVINIDIGYPHRIEDFRFVEGAVKAIARLNANGYLVVVVTNQSGVARGLFEEADMHIFHAHMQKQLSRYGARINAFYFCPYHPQATVERYRCDHPDRKPNAGMIERAIKDLSIDRSRSFLIGDRDTDIQAAQAAGIPGYLFDRSNLDDFLISII
jgi:D-glycero-D-manno-heptose 1,7-bisphosphate phosphatase